MSRARSSTLTGSPMSRTNSFHRGPASGLQDEVHGRGSPRSSGARPMRDGHGPPRDLALEDRDDAASASQDAGRNGRPHRQTVPVAAAVTIISAIRFEAPDAVGRDRFVGRHHHQALMPAAVAASTMLWCQARLLIASSWTLQRHVPGPPRKTTLAGPAKHPVDLVRSRTSTIHERSPDSAVYAQPDMMSKMLFSPCPADRPAGRAWANSVARARNRRSSRTGDHHDPILR